MSWQVGGGGGVSRKGAVRWQVGGGGGGVQISVQYLRREKSDVT